MFKNAEIVVSGTWLYGNSIRSRVRIIKWHIIYGSGDYEDPVDIRNDREVDCYYIQFESLAQKESYNGYNGVALTISDAIIEAEKLAGQKIAWDKK